MTTKAKSFADEYFGTTKSFINSDGSKRIRFCPGLLGIHSDPLAAMFTDEFKEKDQHEFILPDDEFDGMEHILRLWVPLPDRTVPVNKDNVASILPVANKYLMVDVVEQCDLKLAEVITDEDMAAMHQLLEQYTLPNLSVKYEFWKERVSTSDFELTLNVISDGIKNNELHLINLCLPLCIWRKDLITQLKSRNVEVPEKLLLYFNDCLNCETLPWNVNWRLVHDVTQELHDYRTAEIDPKQACYSCDEFTRSGQCATCGHWLCSRCQQQSHSPARKCVQLNYKIRTVANQGHHFQSKCLACEEVITTGNGNDYEMHIEHYCEGKLNEKISWYLLKNNLEFNNIDWFGG